MKSIFRISFQNQGEVYEIYARSVSQGSLLGFVEVEELIFGERSSLLVNPGEEKLQTEFSGVRCTYIPMHSVIRIDEVEKEGPAKVSKMEGGSGNVTPFPMYTGGSDTKK